MAGGGGGGGGRSLEQTPTWAVALVCFVFVLISIIMEQSLHLLGRWFTKKNKRALYEALEKIKSELMLLGFISLLLTVGQDPISKICVSPSLGSTMLPCRRQNTNNYNKQGKGESKGDLKGFSDDGSGRKLLWRQDPGVDPRRMLAGGGGGTDKCAAKGMVPLVSAQGINQLHLFIFVLAVFHVLYCILTMALGRLKMRSWTKWEEESKTLEYHFSHDPERFRFARETSFGRRHMNFWSRSRVLIWIVCFFRQFFASVSKVDYLTLRHGFIMAHLSPHTTSRFDFQKYINRSLEEDFKVVVGISPIIWFVAMLFILFFTHGLYSYFWLPFIPLIIVLLVGTKLQVVITRMALQIQDKGDIVKGVPVVEPTDHLFWFRKPRLILYLIHFVLFQNAFQLAFFVWAWYQFGLRSCFHEHEADIAIRLSMGVLIQFLCSYVTLPLYALVTQMGSTMKPTIFEERVANALKRWHHTARKHVKETRRGTSSTAPTTPRSSYPNTPTHGLSPVHLLRHYRSGIDSAHASPARYYNNNNDSPSPSHHTVEEGSSSHHHHQRHGSLGAAGNELHELQEEMRTVDDIVIEVSHDNISEGRSTEFSFARGDTRNQVLHRE